MPRTTRLAALTVLLSTSALAAPQPAAIARQPAPLKGPRQAALPAAGQATEPRDIVVLARLRSPEAIVAQVQGYVPMPGLRGMLEAAMGPAAKAVAMQAPVDALVTLDPDTGDKLERPLFAFSVGLTSVAEAQRAIAAQSPASTFETQGGALLVHLSPGQKGELYCLLATAPGAAPARMACGDRARDVGLLAPYLLRTLPTRTLGSADLHGELRVPPAMARYGLSLQQVLKAGALMLPQRMQLGQPGFDRALTDLTQGVSGELLETLKDADQATLDVGLGPAGIELRMGYRLRGQGSWIARTLGDEARRSAAPPALFNRLPPDAVSATYSVTPLSGKLAAPIVEVLRALADGWLAHEGLPAPDRKALFDLWGTQWSEAPIVWASGPPDAPPPGKKAKAPPLPFGADYNLGGFAGPADPLRTWLQAVAAAYNRPALQAFLRKKLKDAKIVVPTLRVVPTRELPAALHLQLTFSVPPEGTAKLLQQARAEGPPAKQAAPKGPPVPVTTHLLVLEGGGATWLAMGTELPTLIRRLKAQAGGKDQAAPPERRGLEELRALPPHVSGGFWTLGGVAQQLWRVAVQAGKGSEGEMTRFLSAAPHHGETPMIFFTRTEGSPVLQRELVFRLPKAALEDLVAIALALGSRPDTKQPPGTL